MSYGTLMLIDAINDKKYLNGGDDAFELFINGYNGITVNNNNVIIYQSMVLIDYKKTPSRVVNF